ncbi:protein ECERIFERUM 26-like [Ricinus communis]|uniref:Transferase, putative n=1 Tax=Ricinus communis TaxID=3988 RepID=B9RJZ8_RICCO|nr:protein ECERIFERUM 26-like [Ricinus communis]EEF48306.1 transferase, putative [Ricinus communis]|eukprot:XP_002514352.1 protein ECERIFERUM 26-like [Ricinus communis]
MAEVTYICKRTVVSTKPVQPGKFFPLSVLGRLMERNHLRIVYYFQTPGGREAGEITKKLRESLSELLTCYPIVTGRLLKDQDGQWMVKCNDAGVRVVEARAKGSVEEWLRSLDREKELTLIHWEEMFHKPYFWSTFYVQLTEFEESGFAIGLSCFHPLADPTCATIFMKAWADTTFSGKMISPPLFHPLPPRRPGNKIPNHQPYTHLINHYKSTIGKTSSVTATTGHAYATVALLFTDPMIRACMAMSRTTRRPDQPNPSPFQALSGLFWACISKVKGKENGLIDMSICLDMRKVLGLDHGFFGNCMVYNKVQPKSLSNDKISSATWAIEEEMAKMDTEGIMDLIEWLESNDCQTPPLMNGCDLICANLEGVDPYLAIFEGGLAPIRVSYHVEPVSGAGQVLVLPSPPGEGAMSKVVMVTLPEDEVFKLCEDDLILGFSPAILLGNKK